MLRFLLVFVTLIWNGASASAQQWEFKYGPDFGSGLEKSYTTVSSGPNLLQITLYGDTAEFLMTAVIDKFETDGGFAKRLRAGGPLSLDVFFGPDKKRYERVIPNDKYILKDNPEKNQTIVHFFLKADDVFAMMEGKAVFVVADGLQFRFGLISASEALLELIETARKVKG